MQKKAVQECSPDFITGILQVFSINVYELLDPGATLCFVSLLVAIKFDMFPDVLVKPFYVCTSFIVIPHGKVFFGSLSL